MLAFEIGDADDARQAMGGAHAVAEVETFEAEHALAALGEMIAGGGAHAADAGDDDVVVGHDGVRFRCVPPIFGDIGPTRKQSRRPPTTLPRNQAQASAFSGSNPGRADP